jgi:hypothetical protein
MTQLMSRSRRGGADGPAGHLFQGRDRTERIEDESNAWTVMSAAPSLSSRSVPNRSHDAGNGRDRAELSGLRGDGVPGFVTRRRWLPGGAMGVTNRRWPIGGTSRRGRAGLIQDPDQGPTPRNRCPRVGPGLRHLGETGSLGTGVRAVGDDPPPRHGSLRSHRGRSIPTGWPVAQSGDGP